MIDILITKTGTQLKDFIAALVNPLQYNTDLLKQFEIDQTKHAKWNGQKIVLQAALNDLFGITVSPFIIIETSTSTGFNTFFYEPLELSPVYVSEPSENDPLYIFEPSEIPIYEVDFTIKIPASIWTLELERQVRSQTNIYKLAGKTFNIITY